MATPAPYEADGRLGMAHIIQTILYFLHIFDSFPFLFDSGTAKILNKRKPRQSRNVNNTSYI